MFKFFKYTTISIALLSATLSITGCNSGATASEIPTTQTLVESNTYNNSTSMSSDFLTTTSNDWSIVGTPYFTNRAYYQSLTSAADGTLYIAYENIVNNGKTEVMKFNGTSWVKVGDNDVSTGKSQYQSLAISPDGTLYVAYQDNTNQDKTTVMKFDGISWTPVGSQLGVSAGGAYFQHLSIASNGTVYLAYEDEVNGKKATVMKLNGNDWELVGGVAGISSTQIASLSLAVGSDNLPYIAYEGDNYQTHVMKYNNNSWVNVGTPSTTVGLGYGQSLALDPRNDTPYVAYIDIANNQAPGVMKYDGNSWTLVGSSPVSNSPANFLSLTVDPEIGVVYLAYEDYGNNDEATVVSFDGYSWNRVGSTTDLSQGSADYENLLIDKGNIYIAYQDEMNYHGTTVEKYQL